MRGLAIANGGAVPLGEVPLFRAEPFCDAVTTSVKEGARIASLFGASTPAGHVRLYAVLAWDAQKQLSLLAGQVGESFPSMTPVCPQAHLFEREIYEQFGVKPEGHPWLKPVRAHAFPGEMPPSTQGQSQHPFFAMVGEEVHEVAVGPVHAGVIEPGHFRFQCHGEVVYHLEIHLGYQRRGIEEALVGGPHPRTISHMETVAGDTSIGHGTAYCLNVEALWGVEAPPRAQALRAVALELERLANHVGDLGALANDVGFLPTASFCGKLRGDFLNMTSVLCGSRLGRGLVRPGGVAYDATAQVVADVLGRLERAGRSLEEVLDDLFATQSVLNRFEGTGVVSATACADMGIVGMAARASGLPLDCRTDHPAGWHNVAPIPPALETAGDVFARARVRQVETERSIAYVREQLQRLPPGATRIAWPSPDRSGRPNSLAVAMTEGWRGEVVHVAITDAQGRFARYKVTDPSFHNWTALALALRGQQISDFPLCNKSFNLSYCGFDL